MKLFVCIFVLAHACAIYGKVLPDTLSEFLCHRSDPHLNECLLKQADKILPLLANGVPSAKIDPIDPLNVKFMTTEGELENIKIKMIMKNITLYGHATPKFNKIKVDPESMSGEVAFRIPRMHMTTEYYSTGRLFVIPLESSAYFDGDFNDVDIGMTFRLKEVKRNGNKYFTVEKLTMKMYVESAKIKLTSVDPAQQSAVNVIQNFFNENNRLVLDTVNPLVIAHGPEFYKHIIDRFLRMVPSEELLPQ
ncbi:uncharacterized protein CBL_06215 [Carabus blaptoides fortunei]